MRSWALELRKIDTEVRALLLEAPLRDVERQRSWKRGSGQ